MDSKSQKGVSLVIVFFIMVIILAIVLSLTVILFQEISIIAGIGNSIVSFYAADTGIEKTFYFQRKQIPNGANSGFCNICNACNAPGSTGDCNSCTLTGNDCGVNTCTSCQLDYTSPFPDTGRYYIVHGIMAGSPSNPSYNLQIGSSGYYKSAIRQLNLIYTTP